jgi:hypothetical protein
LTSGQAFSDWVGNIDANDYYRFDLARASSFSLSLNGLSSDANVELLNSTGGALATSLQQGTTAESISRELAAGTYYVRVNPASGNTSYNLTLSAAIILNWFEQNLKDPGLIALGNNLALDGNLSRNDMISLFRDAKDGNLIDANELTDLRTILANASRFTMADSVKVLSNKIVNGDGANARAGFGNLYAGSTATQMENLVGKWFLGNDRPDVTRGIFSYAYVYEYVSGSLFQNGISADDVQQRNLGDCYYLATLSSIAHEKPSYIQNMFIDNGDNTFTVRFFNSKSVDYVTVDRYLPTLSGNAVYAGWGGGLASSTSNELWVALAEKAYAQLAESGWSRLYPGTQANAYAAIEGGFMDAAIWHLTGLGSTTQSPDYITQTQLINRVNSNQILTAAFVNGTGFGVYNYHAYTITSYNPTNGTFHLRNPWGLEHVDLTWSQLRALDAMFQWSNQ